MKVAFTLFDPLDRPLGDPFVFDYVDLSAEHDTYFGAQTPVFFPQNSVRSFSVTVLEVSFSDKSRWESTAQEWIPLPAQTPLTDVYKKPKHVAAYRKKFGAGAFFLPVQYGSLWFCTCGASNRGGQNCHRCGAAHAELASCTPEELCRESLYAEACRLSESQRVSDLRFAYNAFSSLSGYQDSESRLEKVAPRFSAAREGQRKRNRRILKWSLCGTSLLLVLAIVFFASAFLYFIPKSHYETANKLLADGKYLEAYYKFAECDGFEDSEAQMAAIPVTVNEAALSLAQQGKYKEAVLLMSEWEGTPLLHPMYDTYSHMANGRYAEAIQAGLDSFIIGHNTDSIKIEEFKGLSGLKSVTILDTVTSIGAYAFFNCQDLESVVLPSTISNLPVQVFRGCSSLTSITIPASVKHIRSQAFSGCDSLRDIYYEGTEEEWNQIVVSAYGNDSLKNATVHFNSK